VTTDTRKNSSVKPRSHLSEEQRLTTIAELLLSAAARYWRDRDLAERKALGKVQVVRKAEVWDLVDDDTEKQILRYMDKSFSVSPAEIEAVLGIPHTTLVRRLARLRAAGYICVTGRTKRARYQLAGAAQRN
jgi:CRP-like cAMP-binding protein